MGHSSRVLAALAGLSGAVGCGYQGGTFVDGAGRFPGTQVALGCLDLAVAEDYDAQVTGTILEYTFANRCAHPVTVDLGAVQVIGREFSEREIDLYTHDPRDELAPRLLDGRSYGREEIAYVDPWWAGRSSTLNTVCVDVSRIEHAAAPPANWVCIGRGTLR